MCRLSRVPRVRGALITVCRSSRVTMTSSWIRAVVLVASLLEVVLLVFPVALAFLFRRLQA